jgi:hypothetical protein
MVYNTKKHKEVRKLVQANQPKVQIQGTKSSYYKENDNAQQSGNRPKG